MKITKIIEHFEVSINTQKHKKIDAKCSRRMMSGCSENVRNYKWILLMDLNCQGIECWCDKCFDKIAEWNKQSHIFKRIND